MDIAQWLNAVGSFAEDQHLEPEPLLDGSQPAAPAGPVDLMPFPNLHGHLSTIFTFRCFQAHKHR